MLLTCKNIYNYFSKYKGNTGKWIRYVELTLYKPE